MKTILFWTKRNPVLSLSIIASLHFLLIILALFLGVFLFENQIIFSDNWVLGISWVFILSLAFFPIPKNPISFVPTKLAIQFFFAFLILSSSFLGISTMANRSMHQAPYAQKIVHKKSFPAKSFNKIKTKTKNWLGKQVKKYISPIIIKQQKKSSKTGRAIALFFLVIGTAFFILLLIGLAVGLSFLFNDFVAILSFILGLGLILFLATRISKNIFKNTVQALDVEHDERDPDDYLYYQ